jgi:hypothetical protein
MPAASRLRLSGIYNAAFVHFVIPAHVALFSNCHYKLKGSTHKQN